MSLKLASGAQPQIKDTREGLEGNGHGPIVVGAEGGSESTEEDWGDEAYELE